MAKGALNLSVGLTIRIVAALIVVLALPFLILNPANPIWQGIFAFGNFLLVIGANVK
ncbi:MAG TPA: hypothetical protein VJB94_05670 [Candidatus Nanoarchaeia archaeon]|nr:hypothetical protein [Candidatus Nanoarchaeia archaeon]